MSWFTPELFLLIAAAAIAIMATRRSGTSPLMIASWLWVAVAATLVVNPAGLLPVSLITVLVVIVGLACTVLPLWLQQPVPPPAVSAGHVPVLRLTTSALVVGAICLASAIAFRGHIAAVAGTDFGSLTPTQVRALQVGAGRSNVGILGLGAALYPLLACIGVYGGVRHSRLWYVLIALASLASLQTPARLMTLILLVSSAAFYVYTKPAGRRLVRPSRPRKARRIIFGLLVAVGGLVFFTLLGNTLGKNQLNSAMYPQYRGPAWLLSPILYFTGGIPALDVSITRDLHPNEQGNSVYTLYKIASALDSNVHVPDTVGAFVPIPGAFNNFTGYGVAWMDWGWGGLIVLSAILGILSAASHSRASVGRARWAWVSAICFSLLLSSPQTYRVFFLDTVTQLIVGFVVFGWLDSGASMSPGRSRWMTICGRPDAPALAGAGRLRG